MSLSPPRDEIVDIPVFEDAIAQLEAKIGLEGHPRAIVFHEKDGRRHAHVVWSRIDVTTMTAKNMPHFKLKLRDVSRELFFEHGWKMPNGLRNAEARDPRNYSLAEWQAAKRRGQHPGDQRDIIKECWAVSDGRASFSHALSEHGFVLARGDRRNHVVVTADGQVIAVPRALGKRVAEVRAKIGEAEGLPSVEDVTGALKRDLSGSFGRMARTVRHELIQQREAIERRRRSMIETHRAERAKLDAGIAERWKLESQARAARFRSGLSGLWQRATGAYARIRAQNEQAAYDALQRDRTQKHTLIDQQLADRYEIELTRTELRREALGLVKELRRDRDRLTELLNKAAAPKPQRERDAKTKPPRREAEAAAECSASE